MPRAWICILMSLVLFAGCGEDEPSRPEPTLEGAWSLIGYSDHGVPATTSGTATFGSDGTFAMTGEITFPDEPVDSLNLTGTWSMSGDKVTLVTANHSGEWIVSFAGADATLEEVGPAPTVVIRLRRR